jgi:SAM-dependent methyltransferase
VKASCGGGPSPWVERWLRVIPHGGQVLDLACGGGRHVVLLRAHGFRVVAVDRDTAAVAELAARDTEPAIEVATHDLENGPWPFPGRTFAGVVVTNYLWRPLLPVVVGSVAPGGVLVYETFRCGHERFGRPTNEDFLLQPGELLDAVDGELDVLGFEDGPDGDPPVAMRQRICAQRPGVFDCAQGSLDGDARGPDTPPRR